jgi:hypothetical protein
MRYLWYLAQAAFIGWFTYGVWAENPTMTPGQIVIQFGISDCLCAFLTACLTRLWDWSVSRLRRLRRSSGNAGSHGLSAIGTGSHPSQPAKVIEGRRVGE